MSVCDHSEIDFVQKASVLENLSECTLLNKAKVSPNPLPFSAHPYLFPSSCFCSFSFLLALTLPPAHIGPVHPEIDV